MGILKKIFGTGSNDAVEAARQEEERRKAEIAAGQKRIEGIFSSPERNQQIKDFIASQRGLLTSDLNREKGINTRNLKFSLARSGLSGGSVDVDKNRGLSELFFKGTAEVERRAQNSGADLRSLDQTSKQQLFAQLLSGADLGTAAQNAQQVLSNNTFLARQDSQFNNFDNLFANFASYNKNTRIAAGERRAEDQFGGIFGPRPFTQARVAGGVSPFG